MTKQYYSSVFYAFKMFLLSCEEGKDGPGGDKNSCWSDMESKVGAVFL